MTAKTLKTMMQRQGKIPTLFSFLFILISFQSCTQSGNAASASAESEPIFDGKKLDGWKTVAGTAHFEVIDGQIVCNTLETTGNTFLITEKEYTDYNSELDVKIEGAGNYS